MLLRLLLPVAPESRFSLQNMWPAAAPVQQEIAARERAPVGPLPGAYSRPASIEQWMDSSTEAASAVRAMQPAAVIPSAMTMVALAWLGCAIAYLGMTIFTHRRFGRRTAAMQECDDARLVALWEECCRQAEIGRRIPITLCDSIEQPAVMGLLRPRLLLPSDIMKLSDRQLAMIMWHELAHIRAGDVAGNWMLVAVRAVHWWNPVYWLATARFQTLREQACDAYALQRCEGAVTREYSELLLTLSERRRASAWWRVTLPASMVGFVSAFLRKRTIRSRLQALRYAGRRRGRVQIAIAVALVGGVALCGLTDARTPVASSPARDANADWLPRSAMMHTDWRGPTEEVDLGPDVTRTYDLQKAIETITANGCAVDIAVPLMLSMVHRTLRTAENWREVEDVHQWARERISTDGTTLTLTAPECAQADVAQCLQAWEQSGLGQVCIWTRMISDERDLAPVVGIEWEYVQAFAVPQDEEFGARHADRPSVRAHTSIEEYMPIAVATLTAAQVDALVLAAQQDRRASVTYSPKVTMFNGQRATISDCSQSPFVVGVKPVDGKVVEPRIVVVEEGLQLTLRPMQSADRARVHLDGRLELTHIDDVRTASTVLFGEEITIQSPRVRRCRIDIASEVEDGQSLLVCCIPNYDQKKYLYVLLTATELTAPQADE